MEFDEYIEKIRGKYLFLPPFHPQIGSAISLVLSTYFYLLGFFLLTVILFNYCFLNFIFSLSKFLLQKSIHFHCQKWDFNFCDFLGITSFFFLLLFFFFFFSLGGVLRDE